MKEKRFYLIYQITNIVNGKIYIGKHETNNLDDDYFGSGKHLINAQNKYGLENFTKTILFYCQSREEMNLLEKCVVTPEFCQRENVYNLNVGGDGGWQYLNKNNLNGKGFSLLTHDEVVILSQRGRQALNKKLLNKEYRKNYHNIISNAIKQHKIDFPDYMVGKNNPMFNHEYTQKTIDKMRESHLGKKNHMTKKIWICNDLTKESKTILKTDLIPEGWRKGRICKK